MIFVPVYATMRNLSKGEALVKAAGRTLGRTLEIKQLDVCDEDSIKACVDSLPDRRVDILSKFTLFRPLHVKWFLHLHGSSVSAPCPLVVSNAGMGLVGPIECQSMDEMKAVMDTNFFGLVRLVKEILPDMKRRKRGHVVVISSVMGIQGVGEVTAL